MFKKMIGALVSVPIAAFAVSVAGAKEPAGLYEDAITVKLVPSSNFDAEMNGSYELINLEDDKTVEMDDTITFRYEEDNVTVITSDDEDDSHTSSDGFVLQETEVSDNNYVTFTSVQRAGGSFQSTEYRGSFIVEPEEDDKDNSGEEEAVDRLQLYNVLDIEDYIKGVVPYEMSDQWPAEALKAQAIAARNYAKVNMDRTAFLYDTTDDQVYHGRSGEGPNSNQAIRDTEGVYVTYDGAVIEAYYHSSSGGYTDNSENVWNNYVPYIRAVEDPYDTHSANANTEWTETISHDDANNAIFSNSEWELTDLEILEKSEASRVQEMRAVGVSTETGETQEKILPEDSSPDALRWSLGASLNSTMFDVSEESNNVLVKTADGSEEIMDSSLGMKMRQADGSDETITYQNIEVRTASGTEYVDTSADAYEFTGSGFGHGLGMSQWGAYQMAQEGMSYEEILTHYFTGVEIEQR